MVKLKKGYKRFYDFLKDKKVGQQVTLDDILLATGWATSTFNTYLNKNMLDPLIQKSNDSDDFLILNGGSTLEAIDVDAAMSQIKPENLGELRKGYVLTSDSNRKYELLSLLGAGAVGRVWSAICQESGIEVAVKVMDPRPELLKPEIFSNVQARFRRESHNGMRLSHNSILRYLDKGLESKSRAFLVMEQALSSLSDDLKKRKITLDESFVIIGSCLDGLEYLHAQKHIHRDIKPANILRTSRGYVVADLGIVRWSDINHETMMAGTITRDSVLLGSVSYMSPEQSTSPHEAVTGSDVYSLGVSWYEMLTQDRRSPMEFSAGRQPPPTKNESINTLIGRMVAYDPDNRPSIKYIREFLLKIKGQI